MTSGSEQSPRRTAKTNAYRWYSPRCWHGMFVSDVLRLFFRNRLAFSPTRVGLAISVTSWGVFNSLMHLAQRLLLGRKLDAVKIREAPVFIIGHWRSGTTLLHEMLVQDERFAFPDTYECFEPNHFLVSGWFFRPLTGFLLPRQRPMDNMPIGWTRPQEDEFGLLNMGLPTPYEWLAFPNRAKPRMEYLDMEGLTPAELERWQQGLLEFLKCVTYRKPRRLMLKSPPHLGRVEAILELFPDARFIHIVRDPYVVYSSTMRLWKSLSDAQGFQVPRHEGLQEYVFECFERMYTALEKQQGLVDPSRFYELRYEDLIRDPVAQVRTIYEHLELGDFEAMRPQLEKYLASVADYRPNRHDLDPETRALVTQRWGRFIEKYGYATDSEKVGQGSP